MGQSSFVRPAAVPARRNLRLTVDVPLLLAVIALALIGLMAIYSASWKAGMARENGSTTYYLVRQAAFVVLGLAVMGAAYFLDYRWLKRFVVPMMAVTLMALAVVITIAKIKGEVNGRSLVEGSVQPSELAKLMTVLYLSVWMNSRKDSINSISAGLLPMLGIMGLMAGLIMTQPDMSVAFTILIMGGIMLFLAGGNFRIITTFLFMVSTVGLVVVRLYSTGSSRMGSYIEGLKDLLSASPHVQRALEAVARGGLFGVGLGNSLTKNTGLPFGWTDSVFAVLVEETGLIGGLVVIALYGLILWRGLRIAERTPDFLGKLLASGVTLWIILEALLNIAVLFGLLPFTGNALPFLSYGGSSLLTVFAGIGLLLNVNRIGMQESGTSGGKTFGAVVDLRWRDGRRRVSRTGRAASPRG